MSTANNVELLIITVVLCVLFLAVVALIVEAILVVHKIKKLASRAESFIDSVESAAESIKNMSRATHSRFPFLHIIQDILNKDK